MSGPAPAAGSVVVAGALLVLAVAVAYANALPASFQFDDWDVIVRDPRVQDLAAWWAAMPGMRPLLKLSYALNHVSGLGVAGFHAVNVAIHAANGLLVFGIFRHCARERGYAPTGALAVGLGTALLFILHPVQTEAVTYVSGRSTSLSALFALGSIAAWLAWRARGGAWWLLTLSLLLMLAGLGTKETVAVVPVILLAWEATDTSRSFVPRDVVARIGLHGAVLLVGLVMLLALPAYRGLLADSLATRGVADNLLAQLTGIRYLVGQLLTLDGMNADPALKAPASPDTADALTLVGLVIATGFAITWRRRQPLAAFAVLWFLAWLAPTNSVLARLDLVNDRQLYVAMAGPMLLLAAATWRLALRQPALALAAVVVLLALTSLATHLRNEAYRDEVSFWRDVVARSPHNARAFNNLGMALASECDVVRARQAWSQALRLDPGYVRTAVNLKLLEEGVLPVGVGPCRR